jgi:hypothetical protein
LAIPRPTCTAPPTTPATGSTTAPAMPAGSTQYACGSAPGRQAG